jgi:hypothetical protein
VSPVKVFQGHNPVVNPLENGTSKPRILPENREYLLVKYASLLIINQADKRPQLIK